MKVSKERANLVKAAIQVSEAKKKQQPPLTQGLSNSRGG